MKKATAQAIDTLREQITKLSNRENAGQTWITQTQALIARYFGRGSEQYKYIVEFRFRSVTTSEADVTSNINNAINYLNDCIAHLAKFNLHKEYVMNWAARMDGKVLAAWFGMIGAAIFTVSFYMGRNSGDLKSLHMELDYKNAIDTITALKSAVKMKNDTIFQLRNASKKDSLK